MATFQEWWDENYGEFSGQSVQSKIKMRMAYDVGVEHQLTKVDEQQKLIDELQARVDELQTAFKHLIEMNNKSISYEHDLFDKGWSQCAETTINNIYRLTGLGERALKGGEV